jgi:hypothetical protein
MITGQNELGVRDPRIYNNNRFYKKDDNNITLRNLTLEDHLNIQCNASNRHGYVFSDVYLNVLGKFISQIYYLKVLVSITNVLYSITICL